MPKMSIFSNHRMPNVRGLPTVRGGSVKVHPGKGIRINYGWYWTDEFGDPKVVGSSVRVKYDPWDPGHVYAIVKRRWVCCSAKDPNRFNKYSVDEIRREVRKSRAKPVAASLAQFLAALESVEKQQS